MLPEAEKIYIAHSIWQWEVSVYYNTLWLYRGTGESEHILKRSQHTHMLYHHESRLARLWHGYVLIILSIVCSNFSHSSTCHVSNMSYVKTTLYNTTCDFVLSYCDISCVLILNSRSKSDLWFRSNKSGVHLWLWMSMWWFWIEGFFHPLVWFIIQFYIRWLYRIKTFRRL